MCGLYIDTGAARTDGSGKISKVIHEAGCGDLEASSCRQTGRVWRVLDSGCPCLWRHLINIYSAAPSSRRRRDCLALFSTIEINCTA